MSAFVFQNVQNPDIIGAVQAAQQHQMGQAQLQAQNQALLQAQQQMKMQQAQFQREHALRGLYGQYLQGDQGALAKLQTVDPQGLLAFQKSILGNQEAQLGIGKTQREIVKSDALTPLEIAGKQTANDKAQFDLATAQRTAPVELATKQAGLQKVRTENARAPYELDKLLADTDLSRANAAKARAEKTALSTSLQSKLTEEDISAQGMVNNLKTLAALDPVKYLSIGARGYAKIAELADKTGAASDKQKQFLRQRETARSIVSQIFNQYRKEITGAGASVAELEQLKNSILNEDLSPEQFKAQFDRMGQIVNEGIATRDAARNGNLLQNQQAPTYDSANQKAPAQQQPQQAPPVMFRPRAGVTPQDMQAFDAQLQAIGATPEERAAAIRQKFLEQAQ